MSVASGEEREEKERERKNVTGNRGVDRWIMFWLARLSVCLPAFLLSRFLDYSVPSYLIYSKRSRER